MAGNFGVAQSSNGTHFTIVSLNQTGKYSLVDGNALFVDDDGSACVHSCMHGCAALLELIVV